MSAKREVKSGSGVSKMRGVLRIANEEFWGFKQVLIGFVFVLMFGISVNAYGWMNFDNVTDTAGTDSLSVAFDFGSIYWTGENGAGTKTITRTGGNWTVTISLSATQIAGKTVTNLDYVPMLTASGVWNGTGGPLSIKKSGNLVNDYSGSAKRPDPLGGQIPQPYNLIDLTWGTVPNNPTELGRLNPAADSGANSKGGASATGSLSSSLSDYQKAAWNDTMVQFKGSGTASFSATPAAGGPEIPIVAFPVIGALGIGLLAIRKKLAKYFKGKK